MVERCKGLPVGLDHQDKEPGLHGPALCRKILEGLDFKTVGFCRLSTLKPTKAGGYVQISWGGANKFCVLEDLLLWSKGVIKEQGCQCSHLCGNPLCLVPEHIIEESAVENNRRKGCVVWVGCPHGDCPLKILVCQHRPPCILYAPGYNSFADLLAGGIHT
jgi:hypothetical protein